MLCRGNLPTYQPTYIAILYFPGASYFELSWACFVEPGEATHCRSVDVSSLGMRMLSLSDGRFLAQFLLVRRYTVENVQQFSTEKLSMDYWSHCTVCCELVQMFSGNWIATSLGAWMAAYKTSTKKRGKHPEFNVELPKTPLDLSNKLLKICKRLVENYTFEL